MIHLLILKYLLKNLDPKWISLYLPINNNSNPTFYNQKEKKIKVNYIDCNCNKTWLICNKKKLKISDKDKVICIIYSLR